MKIVANDQIVISPQWKMSTIRMAMTVSPVATAITLNTHFVSPTAPRPDISAMLMESAIV